MTALFITVLNMSIAASVVALAVMFARVLLRKAPKIFSYVLWSVVLFRLVIPFSIESIFSLMPTSANAIPHDIVISQNPMIQTGVQFIDIPVNATIYNVLPPVVLENSVNPIHVILEIVGYFWLVGFIALLVYATIGYVNLKRRVYFATLIRDNIFETDNIKSPFVFGFIRPKIYFPVDIDPTQHDYILKHEQTHIKRRDYLIKPFAYIVFAMHWFNPLMWLSYLLMSKDMEMSCDEAVLMETTEDIRNEYSTSLLNLAVKRVSLLNPIAFAFGESNVKERVVNVLNFKKHSKWGIVVSFIVVTVFLVGFASNRATLVIEIPNEQNAVVTQSNVVLPPLLNENIVNFSEPTSNESLTNSADEWFANVLAEAYLFVEESLIAAHADAEARVIADREEAEARVAASDNCPNIREWADEWIASRYLWAEEWLAGRYEWAEEWLAYRYEWAEEMRLLTPAFAVAMGSGNIEAVFAGVEAFGITFSRSLAEHWDEGEPNNIYYQGRLLAALIDDNFQNIGIGPRFMITSGRGLLEDIPSDLFAYVIRDENGNMVGIRITPQGFVTTQMDGSRQIIQIDIPVIYTSNEFMGNTIYLDIELADVNAGDVVIIDISTDEQITALVGLSNVRSVDNLAGQSVFVAGAPGGRNDTFTIGNDVPLRYMFVSVQARSEVPIATYFRGTIIIER